MNNFRPEKDEIIRESRNKRSAIRIRIQHKSNQQKRGENPGEPFDFYRQNKKDVDDFVGIKSRKREEQRCDKHTIGKIAAEKECGDGGANHSDNEIQREPKRSPRSFEAFADKPEKPEREKHPQRTECLRKEDVGDETPNLAPTNQNRIEREKRFKAAIKINQQINQRGKANHDTDQSRDSQKTKPAFEFIQPSHCSAKLAQQSLTSILSTLRPIAIPGRVGLTIAFIEGRSARDTFPLPLDRGEDEGEEPKW